MSQVTSQEPTAAMMSERSLRAMVAGRLSDHLTLVKPGITVMVLITAAIGFAFGAGSSLGGWTSGAWWWLLAVTVVGAGLSCMGAGTLNQVLERDTDQSMTRTKDRPLPAGRMPMGEALAQGLALAVAGVMVLWLGGNLLSALLSAFTIVCYVMVYTPLKRLSWTSTQVGAVPGAMPPVIGYAVAAGYVGPEALLLFAIMALWQIPHFLAIGILCRDDYAAAGMPILPVLDGETGRRTHRWNVATAVALLVAGVSPTLLGYTGWLAFGVALVCGVWFVLLAIRLVYDPSRARARALFLASLVYLPLVLGVLVLDRV
ncbi:heme o synthase [Phycisphaerales bacterium AB-hyl4]|uniref:Protoheme IX farnesyltransferase n=1 Tax=Natronomicrosphaera hydrolytica TaxID=3242702 RepID=A0ABV4U0M4_9BACT